MLKEEYPSYEVREKVKEEGWNGISKSKSAREKVFWLLENVIWSHYWRCRESIEAQKNKNTILRKIRGNRYYSGYTIDMDHYIPNWLYSMKHKVDPEVLQLLAEEWSYEPEESKFLPSGYTIYQV